MGAAIGGAAGVIPNVAGGLVGGAAAAAGAAAGAARGVGTGVASGVGAVGRGIGGVLGGVDFSTLELRYIADTDYSGTGVRYAFAANTQTGTAPSFGGEDNANMASDSFFVWMSLPPQSFTVNLMPNEPDRIIDAQFGRTDAGRILLEADFTMKRATARLIDPATPFGHDFLTALKGGKCFSAQRKWIVPLPASVAQQGDSMYLLDAPLDVKLEILGDDLKPGIGCHSQDAAITRQNDDLYRTTILPKIVDEVNHAPEYADLRRVYASRVAAEWYRQRSATKTTAYSKIINSGNIDAWPARQPWDPKDVFNRYRKSFYEGDATYTWKSDDRTTWTTTIGGVDFTNIPMVNLTPADFTKDHPNLPATATNSLFGARLLDSGQHDSGQQVWLGGLTSEQPITDVWQAIRLSLPDAQIVVRHVAESDHVRRDHLAVGRLGRGRGRAVVATQTNGVVCREALTCPTTTRSPVRSAPIRSAPNRPGRHPSHRHRSRHRRRLLPQWSHRRRLRVRNWNRLACRRLPSCRELRVRGHRCGLVGHGDRVVGGDVEL